MDIFIDLTYWLWIIVSESEVPMEVRWLSGTTRGIVTGEHAAERNDSAHK